jgi:hypothetical protein
MKTLLPIIALALSSCTVVPSGVMAPGQTGNVVQLGGKMKLTTASATLEVDNVESFKDATKLVDRGITVWGLVKSIDRWLDSEDATTATNAATDRARIDADTTATRIASEERLASQAMELEAAETLAAPVATP